MILYKTALTFINVKATLKHKYKMWKFNKYAITGNNCIIEGEGNILNNGEKNNIVIGDNCDIICTLISVSGGKIIIGNNTTIRYQSVVGATGCIKIGSHCIISNNVHIYDNNNHPTDPDIRYKMCESGFYGDEWSWKCSEHKDVIIEDNVWIGERSTILKGVHIGKGSIIGCDSLVSKNVPEYSVVVGNPAKVVKRLKE